ncbi:MAG TPA: molybdopterin dinucleotide binding domain-containing protein, partial [Solirubrobacterales bacterium]|nr:molybdopterin dinucleotide binding domain-containing protein [Solirubrobacterales bacterium]
ETQPSVPGRESGAGSPDTQRGAPTGNTESGDAARGVASAESGPDAPPATSLSLGTYRDLWAGPITELNPPLKFLQPEQRVEIAPADAERLGLEGGDAVRVSHNGSGVEAKVEIKERVQEGVCFLIEGVGGDNANALLNGAPVAVTIEKTAG